jgi:hypothetical protein
MWFRLKKDYETKKGEIHFDSWGIQKIKKGAPIAVGFQFIKENEISPYFIFTAGGVHLELSMLELPDVCEKTYYGDVYCVTNKKFFYASFHNSGCTIARQLIYCPLCGKLLREQADFPRKEKTDKFEIKKAS